MPVDFTPESPKPPPKNDFNPEVDFIPDAPEPTPSINDKYTISVLTSEERLGLTKGFPVSRILSSDNKNFPYPPEMRENLVSEELGHSAVKTPPLGSIEYFIFPIFILVAIFIFIIGCYAIDVLILYIAEIITKIRILVHKCLVYIFKHNDLASATNTPIEQIENILHVTKTLDIQNTTLISPTTNISTYTYPNETMPPPLKVSVGNNSVSDPNRIDFGKQGEKIVLDYEISTLIKAGKKELADKVVDVSDKASLGYDILSFLPDGRRKYIEVKTARSEMSKFYITFNEIEFLKKNDQQAFVYRVIISKQGYHEIIKLTYQQIVNEYNITGDNFLVYWYA